MDWEIIPPTVVIKLSDKTSDEARVWLIKRIRDDKRDGGCQLDVAEDDEMLFVSASQQRLLLGAEVIGLKKEYKDGTLRVFSYTDGNSFKNFQDDDFLLEGECHQIIKTELDGLRAIDESHVPGHPDGTLYPGKSIFRRMEKQMLITDCFPLHNRRELFQLKDVWYRNLYLSIFQPIGAIREYFGYTVGIYFAFLNFYTIGLIPLVVASIYYISKGLYEGVIHNWGLSVIHIVWATLLLEIWKRTLNEYSYKWGYLGEEEWEEPRAGFRGSLGINPITNRQEPIYPKWKRYIKICFVSTPAMTLCLALSISMMFYYFQWEIYLSKIYNEGNFFGFFMMNLPSIVYSVMVLVLDLIFRHLAQFLTDFENHRLESSFQNHLIMKILLLTFANNFLCLFYVAFVYEDAAMLRTTLRNLFLVHMLISQANESLLPYWMYKARSSTYRSNLAYTKGFTSSTTLFEKVNLTKEEQAGLELQREAYTGTFDDYLELWLQFGYVVLFSCVFPPAAIFAFANNLIEEKLDAFKICNVYRRPFSHQTSSINVWQIAFACLSYLSIVCNLALLFRSEEFLELLRGPQTVVVSAGEPGKSDVITVAEPLMSDAYIVLIFFLSEHVLLLIRWLVSVVIPEVPRWVRIDLQKIHYWSIQALKQQRSLVLRPSASTK